MKIISKIGITFALFGELVAQECTQKPVRNDEETESSISKCLPDSLLRDFVSQMKFLEFSSPDESRAPVGNSFYIEVDGKQQPLEEFAAELFLQKHYARIPSRTSIIVSRIGEKNIWEYPVATELVHEIYWKTAVPELFELRLTRKLKNGIWAFGVYTPDSVNPRLLRLRKDGVQIVEKKIAFGGGIHSIQMESIHPESCRSCHASHGSAIYQYGIGRADSMKWNYAGPCGFSPERAAEVSAWSEKFRTMFGYHPFKNRTDSN